MSGDAGKGKIRAESPGEVPSSKRRKTDAGERRRSSSPSSTRLFDALQAIPTGTGEHDGEGSHLSPGMAKFLQISQEIMKSTTAVGDENPLMRGMTSFLDRTTLSSDHSGEVDQQIEARMAQWKLEKERAFLGKIPKQTIVGLSEEAKKRLQSHTKDFNSQKNV